MSGKREKQSSNPDQSTEEDVAGSPGGAEGWGESADNESAGLARPLDDGTQEPESTARKTMSDAVNSAGEAIASPAADAGEALETAARAARDGVGQVASQAYVAGTEATDVLERQMSERPWMTLLAGTLLGCVLGYVFASRR